MCFTVLNNKTVKPVTQLEAWKQKTNKQTNKQTNNEILTLHL